VGTLLRNPTLVARYLPGGRLDPSFGRDGRVSLDMLPRREDCCPPLSIAVEPDGKMVIAFADMVARLDADGSLDPTFGHGGEVQIEQADGFTEELEGVTVTPRGKTVVAGEDSSDFGLFCLLQHGQPDPTFGHDGRVRTDFFGGCDRPTAMAVDRRGFIVLAGVGDAQPCDSLGRATFEMARYRPDGHLDVRFGRGGRLIEHRGNMYGGGGLMDVAFGPPGETVVLRGVRVLRFHADGGRDVAFGRRGSVKLPVPTIKKPQVFDALAVDGEGRTVVAGATCFCGAGNPSSFEVFRFLPSGLVDPTFGVGGRARTSFGGTAVPWDVAVDPEGRAVVVGGTNWTLGAFAVARYRG